MTYFELEESRLKNLLKMEKLWGNEKKEEGEVKLRVRCTNCPFRNTVVCLSGEHWNKVQCLTLIFAVKVASFGTRGY